MIEVALVRAANPSPMTLSGTNTWVVGRDPAWVVDPGPALPAHIAAVAAAVEAGGGAGGIVLTHDHADHAEGVPALADRLGGPPVAAMRHPADVALGDGDVFGPFTAVHLPGHAPDHLVLIAGDAGFTGDACSERAACSSPRTAAGSPPISTASAACARSASPVSTRGTVP